MTRSLVIVTILALVGSLAAISPAIAQGDLAVQAGITTTGYGEASAPAASVRLEFLIISQDVFFGGAPQAPQVEDTPGAMAQETVFPIVDAIQDSGMVESVGVVVPLTTEPFSQGPLARIDVVVPNPDLAGLTSLVTGVVQAAAGDRLLVGYVGAQFEASDCAALERDAREAALTDAEDRAGIQADLLGVALGDVVAVVDVDSETSQASFYGARATFANNCDPAGSAIAEGSYGPGATLPRFDPTVDSGAVEVHRQLQVTFVIDASEATPAA